MSWFPELVSPDFFYFMIFEYYNFIFWEYEIKFFFLQGEVDDDYFDFVDDFTAQNSVTTQEEIQKRSSPSPESYTSDYYSIFVPKSSNGNNNVSGTTICFGGGGASPERLDFQTDGGFERPVKRVKVDNNKTPNFHALSGSTKGDFRRCSVAHEHVLAERKRREKLTQKFIALSAILPGLKKVNSHICSMNIICFLVFLTAPLLLLILQFMMFCRRIKRRFLKKR